MSIYSDNWSRELVRIWMQYFAIGLASILGAGLYLGVRPRANETIALAISVSATLAVGYLIWLPLNSYLKPSPRPTQIIIHPAISEPQAKLAWAAGVASVMLFISTPAGTRTATTINPQARIDAMNASIMITRRD